MARSSTVSENEHSDAIASGLSTLTVQNIGPGVGFVIIAASAPAANVRVGDVGFRLYPGEGLDLSNLGGSVNFYAGALAGDTEFEYLST